MMNMATDAAFLEGNAACGRNRQRGWRLRLYLAALVCLAAHFAGAQHATGILTNKGQQQPSQQLGVSDSPMTVAPEADDRLAKMTEDLARQRNAQRQKKLVDDTNRLLAMANELKASVDKTTKDTLSLQVIRQADEIERLAKSVKDKMRAD